MLKPIFRILAVSFMGAGPVMVQGAILTPDEAKVVATGFFRTTDTARLSDADALELAHTEKADAKPLYYVFNATDGKGFIIVSADDTALPVMAYSSSSSWLPGVMPEAAGRLLDTAAEVSVAHRRERSPRLTAAAAGKVLPTATWSQEAPFNGMIPNRPPVGCVGTALAEILRYHRYPAGRPSSLVKDGEPTVYDWDNMRDDNYRSGYTATEADAVATLVADAAYAIGTDFGMSSSSAFEVKVPAALVSMFGYDAGVSYKKGSEMNREDWDALIVNEIDNDRPVLYCGQDVSAGHAFVCDGYEMHGSTVYLHINWGWGGAADGFFASDALTPTVSMSHNFSNLTTIVYNIKPAADTTVWSPVHLTSDEGQIGMTLDAAELTPGTSFTVRAGALKNISDQPFSGTISLALFSADGQFKQLLCDGKRLGLPALQVLKYTDFTATMPADISADDTDVVKLVTRAADSSDWLPVANDLLTVGEARVSGNVIPYAAIDIPATVDGVEIVCDEPRVIKGRDFSFRVVPESPEKVVTVKANGFILTPSGSDYTVSNVTTDQTITITVQDASEVVSKRILWVQAGQLGQLVNDTDAGTIKDLTLYGTINASDFTFMRDRMKLTRLDISGVRIVASGVNPANAIPAKAFTKYGSLKQLILPRNVNTFKSGCFSYSGLTSIDIPASVATYEYNIFLGCSSLSEVTVRRSVPAWVNWCVFEGTPKATLIVPEGSAQAYQSKENWQDFKEIIERNPAPDSVYTVTMEEIPGIRFTPLTELAEVAPGAQYEFRAESDDSFGDATLELYANNTRLSAGQNGVYSIVINSNTFIHANIRYPEATVADSPWKITASAGGVGLVTDVVNVVPGKSFTIRANALAIPSQNADQYYCVALTDKDGAIKELISPVIYNSPYNFGNLPANFTCIVKDATVREGNLLRVVSSLDKKRWCLVNAESDSIADRISAIGNRVVYYNVNMPEKVVGAVIQGSVTKVVRGMPFSLKVTPVSVDDRITVSVNGINKVVDAAIANITIPAVVEDLDVAIQVNPKGSDAYTVVNVREGELAAKIAQCPSRLKVTGVMRSEDFDAFRQHAATIVDLDLADVTIKGAVDLANAIPSRAFASSGMELSALKTIILPTNLVNIEANAFYRCVNLAEITLPATVAYVGDGAFASCVALRKIIAQRTTPPATGNMTPFPANTAEINLEVPAGAEGYYSAAQFWGELGQSTSKVYYNIQIDPERTFSYNGMYSDLTKIEVVDKKVQVTLGLPNFKPLSTKPNPTYRPGIAFKLYDNGNDVTTTSSYLCYGQHSVVLDPDPFYQPGSIRYPQDHVIEVVFHYPLEIHSADGLKTEFVGLAEADVWRGADMSLFVPDSPARPTLFKEGEDYKFRVISDVDNVKPDVVCVSHVMTSFGDNPQFTDSETILVPDENGIYTIRNLQGSVDVRVTASVSVENGSTITPDEISLVDGEDSKDVTDIALNGELSDKTFSELREKFPSLENLNLEEMQNDEIPAGAFENMENLKSVVIPSNVTGVGAEAFAGCVSLETVTLPGVETIGAGAFDGCTNLTSISILGRSETGAPVSRAASESSGGISADAFKGINPNCLVYVTEAVADQLDTLSNVIVNRAGARVAAADIVLSQRYPFNVPASFSLGDKCISFTADIPGAVGGETEGWGGLIMPFVPDSISFGIEFTPRSEYPLALLTFEDGDEEWLVSPGSIEANRPYLANVHAPADTVALTFIAGGKSSDDTIIYDVPATPSSDELVSSCGQYTLYGTYTSEAVPVDGNLYMTDSIGASFNRVASDSIAPVVPFAVYLRSADLSAAESLPIGNHAIWVFDPVQTDSYGSVRYRSEHVELCSDTEEATIYYTTDGSDPAASDTRMVYNGPIAIDADSITVKAVAEINDNLSATTELTYELKKTRLTYSLAEGWSWISHNAENAVAVEEIMDGSVERVLSSTGEAYRYDDSTIAGDLTALDPVAAYKVFAPSVAAAAVEGIAFDPATPVTLNEGSNWIGIHAETGSMSLGDILANLQPDEGDVIVGRAGFAQADAEGKWIGNLGSLQLGHGYIYFSQSDKQFTYNMTASEEEDVPVAETASADIPWSVESSPYSSVMAVTACLVGEGGEPVDDDEFVIGAFCGDECRGFGTGIDGLTMMSVFGEAGDMINFRILSAVTGEELELTQALVFEEKPVGTLAAPYSIDVTATSAIDAVTQDGIKITVDNGVICVDADTDTVKRVEVYDTAGVREASAMAGESMTFARLGAGVHIVVVYTPNGHTAYKVETK